MGGGRTLARGLGVFSLGLGIYQLVAPRAFTQLIGIHPERDAKTATRAVGARELGAAAGLLASPKRVGFMWLRVAGDVMDLALLRRAMSSRATRPDRAGAAFASAVGITAVDLVGTFLVTREAQRNGRGNGNGNGALGIGAPAATKVGALPGGGSRRVVRTITVERPRGDVYGHWRDFTNLPGFMHHLEEVRVLDGDGRRSHWRARAPLGMAVEWEAEMTEDIPEERIAWRSIEGSQVANAGVVSFSRGSDGRGTVVRVELEYDPPGGPLGVAIARLTGEEPDTQTAADLRRFKQLMETGEVVVTDATIGGRRLRQRPARPAEPAELAAEMPAAVQA